MGFSPSDPDSSLPPPGAPWALDEPPVLPPPRRREPRTRYVVLFLLTLATTTIIGAGFYGSFASDIGQRTINPTLTDSVLHGFWYSLPVLLILGAHEFGHYFACRYYGIQASLPYFIPFPLGLGTLGAVIRIRQRISTKRELFDMGIAGPVAGFVVLVPVLVLAMMASNVVDLPPNFQGISYGEPLLFKLVSHMVFGSIGANQSVNLHPAGWAAWLGMLATALNLAPASQLDGGHISYAVFGRRSSAITVAVVVLMAPLLFLSIGYAVWTALLVVMVLVLGPHHPPVDDEHEPLDGTRLILAAFAVVMFVLCFTPVPVEVF